jgi:hypothetical protein
MVEKNRGKRKSLSAEQRPESASNKLESNHTELGLTSELLAGEPNKVSQN